MKQSKGYSKMGMTEAEEELINQFESTYEMPQMNFIPPTRRLLDPFIIKKLENIYAKQQDKKDGGLECDWWTAIIGGEGTGKSTFAANYIWEYCKLANKDYVNGVKDGVAFDEFDMVRMISKIDPNVLYNFIWADEGANVFFNRDSATIARKWSIKFANSMRFLRYFVVVCSVELKQLDTIIRDHRIKSLIRIQEHGIYHYYNHEQTVRLLARNHNNRDAGFNWRVSEPEHVGSFQFSEETKKIVDILKKNYLIRFGMEAKQEYTYMLRKKLFKLENTKDKKKDTNRWKWNS